MPPVEAPRSCHRHERGACEDRSIRRLSALVLHDLIEVCDRDMTRPGNPVLSGLAEGTYVLVPLAYAYDEPIDELIAAQR